MGGQGQEKYKKMNIKKTIITATVALTMVAMIAPAASAVTIADLQAQINALMAQLQALQGTTSTGSTPAVCVGITFSRNLTVGSVGSDVKCLQALLNTSASTQVSTSGAGSPGMETTYFGSRTLAAVRIWQAQQGWTPASQIGPLSRANLNAWLSGTSSTPTPPGPTPTPVPTGAGLSVMLASDNPASGTVVDASSLHPMMKLVFTNGDNAEVKITGVKLKRIGASADASLTNTYLFMGTERLTDGAAVSETVINFNNSAGLFTVPANGSATISVLSDVDGAASEQVALQVVSSSSITSNASSVTGTYPITGNNMTISVVALAGVEWNATTTPSAASIDPQDGYTVFQNSVIVTTRAVDLKRISFRRTGSVTDTDLQNFKLYVDGVQVGSTVQLMKNRDGFSYASFDLTSAPRRLEAGTRVIKVLADIVGGSNSTFTMHLWNVADVTVMDTQLNANVLSDLVSDATFTKRSTGEQTVNAGTITITKLSTSPSGDIVDGASNATLAKFEFKAAGEKVKVENLIVSAVVSDTAVNSLRNGMLLANGVQVGSTTTLNAYATSESASTTTFNFGSSLIVEPGSPVIVEVRADIFDNDGTNSVNAADTIIARLEGASTNNNATGLVSSTTLDIPASDTDGNTLTVRQGSLTLSKYTAYTDHSVVAPLTAYKLGHYTLTAATSEAVNVSAINVTLGSVSTYTTNLYVTYGTQTSSIKTTVSNANTWSINYNLPAGQTIDVMVFADIASGMSSGTSQMTTDVDGTTASSAVSADSSGTTTGQTLTYTAGAFTTAFDGTPQNQAVSGNQSVLAGKFKLTSSYRDYTAKEMRFTANSNSIVITSATLKDAATGAVLATVPYDNTNSYFNFTGLSFAIPASTSKRVDLYYNLIANPSATNASWNLDTKAILTYIKYADSQGTETTVDPPTAASNTANSTIVYKSVPTFAAVNLTNSTLINGSEVELYKFTVKAPSNGPIHIKQLKVNVGWSDGGGNDDTLELESMKLYENGTDITSTVLIQDQTGGTVESTSGISELSSKLIFTWDDDTEESTTSANETTTFSIRGTPQGFNKTATTATYAASDSVSLQLVPDSAAQTSGYNYITRGSTQPAGVLRLFSSSTASDSGENANLIWSDESAVAHSPDDDSSTKDWSNSYLFNAIESEAWTD